MSTSSSPENKNRQLLLDAQKKGGLAVPFAFLKLSGPGWLQSAITLGGGSLAGALYLGVIGGTGLLWVQLTAIITGVIMLSAISYVTLSTGKRPFQAIRDHINPVLAWSWALATLAANIVWCLPQFSLATASMQQNLLPGVVGADSAMGDMNGKAVICAVLLIITISIVWLYEKGGWHVKVFDWILKGMVAVVVLSFFGVTLQLALSNAGLHWGEILRGFIPDFSKMSVPADAFLEKLNAIKENVGQPAYDYWYHHIVSIQRDIMIAAVATAVGINMTFLLPYSMLSRGWDRPFRGVAIFDLSTGMAIPYVLVTSCVVIAAASQFHGKPALSDLQSLEKAPAKLVQGYHGELKKRIAADVGSAEFAKLSKKGNEEALQKRLDQMADEEKLMAAMLVKRDAFNLAETLAPLTGKRTARYVFGIGVMGMAVSTIIILMLISGFVITEMLGLPQKGWAYRLSCLAPAVGVLGPFFWKQAAFYLAVPTSVFGMVLLPVAYFTFFLMMNNKNLMGDAMPRGMKRFVWNTLMSIALTGATFAAGWAVWSKVGWYGAAFVALFLGLLVWGRSMVGKKA